MNTVATHTLAVSASAKTMTLEEIEAFFKAARDAGATGAERPAVRIALSGAIKNMTIRVG